MRPGQTISATKTTRRLGGKGGNQARALGSAGGLALMDGCVGDDAEGRGAVESLTRKRAGEEGRVDSERVRYWAEGVTGKAIIQLAEDGENSISGCLTSVYYMVRSDVKLRPQSSWLAPTLPRFHGMTPLYPPAPPIYSWPTRFAWPRRSPTCELPMPLRRG